MKVSPPTTSPRRNARGDRERAIVRDLAQQVAGIAHEPRMEAIRKRWRDVNELRRPDRAPVYCRPVGCWKEILPDNSMVCTDSWLRGLEYGFRQTLHKREIDDDTPVEPYIPVAPVFEVTPANGWGVEVVHRAPQETDGAWAYDPPLKTADDFANLALPTFRFNQAETERQIGRLEDLLGDILPVRPVCDAPISATLGTVAADLRGLEQIMMDMADAPELMHRLMSYLRDAALGAMDQVAATGLLTPNNNGPMTTSDPFGPPARPGKYSYQNSWCMANSQEFDQVSPAMWEEFLLAYQRPIFERFGRVGYGCCENLTRKIDGVLSIPNLRIFVCSAWTDLSAVRDRVGTRCCIMWRQKASEVVFPDDTAPIRRHLEQGAKLLQGHPYQIVLRELQTLAGHPDRLHVWTRLAKSAAEQYS